jgi:hypothetical protein
MKGCVISPEKLAALITAWSTDLPALANTHLLGLGEGGELRNYALGSFA